MDIRLYAEERGSGEPLVLLHGNGESGEIFSGLIGHFSGEYRVIAPDTRGHGRSPRGERPFTISQFADDLYDFLTERGIERSAVLGFSDGGNIALLFALRHPEMVTRLILNGANLDPSGVKRRYQKTIEREYARLTAMETRTEQEERTLALLSLMVNEPHIDPAELGALTVPVLVLAGTRDMIARPHTRLIAQSLPNAELCLLEGSHFLVHECPDEYERAVEDFLRRTKRETQ